MYGEEYRLFVVLVWGVKNGYGSSFILSLYRVYVLVIAKKIMLAYFYFSMSVSGVRSS